MKSSIIIPSLSLFVLALASCGGEDKPADETQPVDTAQVTEEKNEPVNEVAEFKFHVFMANVPSPLETMILLPTVIGTVDKNMLDPIDNADKYVTANKKALNYGVYGADLGYLVVYNQTTEVTDYFATLKSLAEDLGAGDQFNSKLSERFMSNMDNQDSLLMLMDKALAETEVNLKTNQRLETASLMLTGSWVESQYILIRTLIVSDGHGDLIPLYNKVLEARAHLKSLIDLLGEQKSPDCKKYQGELEAVLPIYEGIKDMEAINEKVLEDLSDNLKKIKDKITAVK